MVALPLVCLRTELCTLQIKKDIASYYIRINTMTTQ